MVFQLKQAPWPQNFDEARQFQEDWSGKTVIEGDPIGVRHIAGVDLSCERGSPEAWVAVVVLKVKTFEVVEKAFSTGIMGFPYVPGYLSFREGPLVVKALEKVKTPVDLWFFDGQGLAHPRRFGLACHMGLYLDAPSIGVAKNRFVGTHKALGMKAGNRVSLEDDGQHVGEVLRTRDRVKPVYVSPGHKISVKAATDWTFRVTRKLRIPEPTRQAHMLVNHYRRGTI